MITVRGEHFNNPITISPHVSEGVSGSMGKSIELAKLDLELQYQELLVVVFSSCVLHVLSIEA